MYGYLNIFLFKYIITLMQFIQIDLHIKIIFFVLKLHLFIKLIYSMNDIKIIFFFTSK